MKKVMDAEPEDIAEMGYANPDALVSPEWLAKHLDAPDVCVVDATYHLPDSERDAREEYGYRHIPGAVFFDVDEIADSDTELPHMLPSPEKFSAKVRKLGLGDGKRIVVYDSAGGFLATTRVWWMFRVFGHEDIAVLDGGLRHWDRKGFPMDDRPTLPRERHFTARVNTMLVRDIDQMLRNVDGGGMQVVDARNAKRFHGEDWEPRPVKKRGHIPGSFNVPFSDLMRPREDYRMRPADEIRAAFDAAGVDPKRPVVTTCGSGLTACVNAFALYLLGHDRAAVYDGSWAEWGNRDDTPVET